MNCEDFRNVTTHSYPTEYGVEEQGLIYEHLFCCPHCEEWIFKHEQVKLDKEQRERFKQIKKEFLN